MKGITKTTADPASLPPRAILDQIRNDHELIARLHITPGELEALSKCALMGTLTGKQDMLFILRQIRDAITPSSDNRTLFPKPPEENEFTDDSDRHQGSPSIAAIDRPEPGSPDSTNRRRIPEHFGIIFWVVVLLAGVVWNGTLLMSHMQGKLSTVFSATVGAAVSSAPVSDGWYSRFDHANVLLFWEILLVVVVAASIQLKSRHDSRRFKVRPGQKAR